jgi:hypothetical protein
MQIRARDGLHSKNHGQQPTTDIKYLPYGGAWCDCHCLLVHLFIVDESHDFSIWLFGTVHEMWRAPQIRGTLNVPCSALYWQSSVKCFQNIWSSVWGPDSFTLVFFGAIAAADAFLLAGPNKAATVAAAWIMDSIPVRSMSSSPDFFLALLLTLGYTRCIMLFRFRVVAHDCLFLAFILLDSSEGGVCGLSYSPLHFVNCCLGLGWGFLGSRHFQVLAIVVDLSFDF